METQVLTYRDEEVSCKGFLAYEKEGAPLVLVAPAWRGQDDFAREKAMEMARWGYAGFAIDMYGDGICVENEKAPEMMAPFFLDRAYLQKRILAAFNFAKNLPLVDGSKVGAIGFCFGGLCVYELLRSGAPLDAAVSFHGVFAVEKEGRKAKTTPIAKGIRGSFLLLHGNDDPMVSDEDLKRVRAELTEASVDWQIHTFGNTMHAFTNPKAQNPEMGTVFQPLSCKRAFALCRAHFSTLWEFD